MRIVKAGHPPRVPLFPALCTCLLMMATAGCSMLHPSQPQRTATTGNRDAMAALLASTLPSATEPATPPPVVTETPTALFPASAPATEPGSPLPPPIPARTLTSNGAEFEPRGQTVHVDDTPTTPLQFSGMVTYLHGGVNGSVQIPKGGKVGTSSGNRPRLNGMGIDTADIPDVEIGAKWDANEQVFFGAQFIQLDGAATVPRTLVSQGITFPKGGRTNDSLRLDWYRLGYKYTFDVDTAANGIPDITLTPQIDAVIWNFAYNYHVRKVGTATRSFAQPGMQIGGTIAWRPEGGPFSLEAYAATFPQIQNLATISVESVYATYHFYDWRRFNFTGRLGVEWEQQTFKDGQKLPNRINIDFGPMLLVGLQVAY